MKNLNINEIIKSRGNELENDNNNNNNNNKQIKKKKKIKKIKKNKNLTIDNNINDNIINTNPNTNTYYTNYNNNYNNNNNIIYNHINNNTIKNFHQIKPTHRLQNSMSYKSFRPIHSRYLTEDNNNSFYNYKKSHNRNINSFNDNNDMMNNSFFGTNTSRGYNPFIRNDLNNRSYHTKITFPSHKSNTIVVKLRGGAKIILGSEKKRNFKY